MSADLLDTPTNGGSEIVKAPAKDIIKSRLPKMLLTVPKAMHERFREAAIAVAMTPNVAACEANSVVSAVYACARLNLIPDPVLKQAYIIPFKGKATVILGYPGLIELARRACPGLEINTGIVFSNDTYTLLEGTETSLKIVRRHWQDGAEPEEVLFAYCVFKSPEATNYTTVIVPRYKLDAVANSKRRPGVQSPWDTNFSEMCEKTAIRRAARLWTLSPDRREDSQRFREALAVDDAEELPSMPAEENADLADMAEGEHAIGGGTAETPALTQGNRKRVNATVK